ncbi:MAG: serine/threonine protein kinase [Anaeromyxobacter sp.]|nr:serine/threonine protein kinase [Anaeromyxobacter sp.]MBL0277414.1 serine/threonine protein kinase [Anaeromyxobacter sp.]
MVEPGSSESARREGNHSGGAAAGAEGRLIGGRYRVLQALGSGGMGSVYLCEHATLGRRCAVKVLHADRAIDPELVERFRQEAQAASRIAHENVVEVVDYGQDEGGDLYYVMEMLEGRTLGQLMRQEGPLPVPRALALLEQLCRALEAAHARGVVHRDVKPANILVELLPDGTERVKLIDFGISHVPGADRMTRDGEIIGTPEYMAPEQATGGQVDPLTDVYAVGVLAFELLTGTLPLVGSTAIATLVAHQSQVPPRLGSRRAGLPPELDRLVLRALAKRPADRFPSMQALAAEVMRVRLVVNLASASGPTTGRTGTGAVTGRGDTIPLPALPPLPDGAVPLATGPATQEAVRLGTGRPLGRVALAVGVLALLVGLVVGLTVLAGRRAAPEAPQAVAAPRAVEAATPLPPPAAPPPVEAPPVVAAPAAAPLPAEPPPVHSPPAAAPPAAAQKPGRPDAARKPAGALQDPYATQPDPLKPDPFR